MQALDGPRQAVTVLTVKLRRVCAGTARDAFPNMRATLEARQGATRGGINPASQTLTPTPKNDEALVQALHELRPAVGAAPRGQHLLKPTS